MSQQNSRIEHYGNDLFRLPYADNEIVTDQLFLSIWLEPRTRAARLRHFEALLRVFPFSQRPQPQSTVSIHAIDTTEPPVLERDVNGPVDVSDLVETLRDYHGDDVAYEIEGWWDLWQFEDDWKLAPTRVLLSCFGPEYDNGTDREAADQEDLRIDFGVDTHYLPRTDIAGGARLTESNIRSLLRVVHEMDAVLPVQKRRLETESGGNFAERLQQVLSAAANR